MRTAIMTICYGLALAAFVGGLALIGYGLYEQQAIYTPNAGLAAVGIYMRATNNVALGAAALAGAALLALAGRAARA